MQFSAQITEQMFRLIDSMLSFEACLYHQVLPLSLEESSLKLGMVNPEDTAALDYVGRILSYMNCSLVSQPIATETHKAMLSAYLSYTKKSKLVTELSLDTGHSIAQATATFGKEPAKANFNAQPTLILADTEGLNVLEVEQVDSQINPSTKSNTQVAHVLPPLAVPLNPQKLLQELLSRVLAGGIGRLYFERQFPQCGRILWSQNGVLQSVLENLPLPVFQAVIDELKRMTHLPLIPVQEPKQVEIERLYQKKRLLLRLRLMPGADGEEATLQVLRGAALKFYQQQQIAHLGQDALTIAQQLQRKVNELRERADLNPSLSVGLQAMPALNQLIDNLDQQLEALKQLKTQPPPSENNGYF